MKMKGSVQESLIFLQKNFPGKASEELAEAVGMLCKEVPADKLCIDFSVVNDMNYYNGIVFRGYVNGIPSGMLSGGQYGSLVRKMGKNYEAIGFAVYLDMLEELKRKEDGYDVDVLVVYGDDCDLEELAGLCAGLRNQGESVTALKNIPERFRYRRLLRADGGKSHG